jgi:hypothetical protein
LQKNLPEHRTHDAPNILFIRFVCNREIGRGIYRSFVSHCNYWTWKKKESKDFPFTPVVTPVRPADDSHKTDPAIKGLFAVVKSVGGGVYTVGGSAGRTTALIAHDKALTRRRIQHGHVDRSGLGFHRQQAATGADAG